jgi:enoyl-CoA hydratase/carnithine racemase
MAEIDPFTHPWRCLKVEREDHVCTVTLGRVEARNALNSELMSELTEFARAVRLSTEVWAIVLTGEGTFFSAGADLKERGGAPAGLMDTRRTLMAGPDLCRAWEEIEAVTIAAVEGYCIGGACALAVSCDFRVLGKGAYFRLPEVPLGMNMSWRSLPRLVALAGPSRAKRFVMFGEAADAETSLAWGMADEVVEAGGALEAAHAWARKVVALPPLPVRMTKEAINAIAGANAHASIHMDRDQYLLASRSNDYREGIAAFREKRDPKFTGS